MQYAVHHNTTYQGDETCTANTMTIYPADQGIPYTEPRTWFDATASSPSSRYTDQIDEKGGCSRLSGIV